MNYPKTWTLLLALLVAQATRADDRVTSLGTKKCDIITHLRQEVSQLDAPPSPGFPVVDMHTHTFNASYIPVEQIARIRTGEVLNLKRIGSWHTYAWLTLNGLRYLGQPIPYVGQYLGQPEGTSTLAMIANMLAVSSQVDDPDVRAMKVKIAIEGRNLNWLSEIAQGAENQGFKDYSYSPHGVRLLAQFLEQRETRRPLSLSDKCVVRRAEKLINDELEARVYLGSRVLISKDCYAKLMRSELRAYQRFRDWFQRGVWGDHYVARTWSGDMRGILNLMAVLSSEHGGHGEPIPEDCTHPSQRVVYKASQGTPETLGWFLLHITEPWAELPKALLDREYPFLALGVHQMMAMHVPYNEVDATGQVSTHSIPGIPATALTQYGQQLKQHDQSRKESAGRSAYFAGWNPFSSRLATEAEKLSWRRGLPENPDDYPQALAEVHRAISQHGAWGIKFYPPMGFRPTGNGISCKCDPGPWDEKVKWYARQDKKAAWQCRYGSWGPEDMDALNALLFEYCVKFQIPLFTHCNTGEFQASGGYARFSNPRYWEMVLQQKRFRNLRLCLGHAGGHDYWFTSDVKHEQEHCKRRHSLFRKTCDCESHGEPIDGFAWGKQVAKLCICYPNVYCEVGIHSEVCDPVLGAEFVMRMDSLLNSKSPALRKKIMYGTDWYMPISETPNRYMNGYLHAWSLPELSPHKRAFFSTNALNYLRLNERLKTLTRGLSNSGAKHLHSLSSTAN